MRTIDSVTVTPVSSNRDGLGEGGYRCKRVNPLLSRVLGNLKKLMDVRWAT